MAQGEARKTRFGGAEQSAEAPKIEAPDEHFLVASAPRFATCSTANKGVRGSAGTHNHHPEDAPRKQGSEEACSGSRKSPRCMGEPIHSCITNEQMLYEQICI